MSEERKDLNYVVKGNQFEHKEVDLSKRTVDLIANTYYWFDSDGDVLLPGCASKSISERGPQATSPGKIKHLKGHDMDEMIAVPKLIEEIEMNGRQVLHCNSYFPESEDSENELINYGAGMYDQHSIGFRYVQAEYAEKDSAAWNSVIGMLINPEDAIAKGFMFLVKEIALYEYSTVAFGANRLTPYLGSKSTNKTVRYNSLVAKLDSLLKCQGGDKFTFEVKERQLKQMLFELMTEELNEKPLITEPAVKTILDIDNVIKNFNFKL